MRYALAFLLWTPDLICDYLKLGAPTICTVKILAMATDATLQIVESQKPSGGRYRTGRGRRARDKDFSSSVAQKEALDFGDSEEVAVQPSSTSGLQEQRVFSTKRGSVQLVVWMVRAAFLVSILTCLVMSKLTILKILSELHVMSAFRNVTNYQVPIDPMVDVRRAVTLYWQLFLVVMIPNLLAWLRSFYYGILIRSHWPTNGAIAIVSI